MNIYFGTDNTRPANIRDLAGLLNTDQRTAQDAIQICCPASAHEPGVHRILQGDSQRLRSYIAQRRPHSQRRVLDEVRGQTFHRCG